MHQSLIHQFIEKWIYNILHLRKVYPYHSFETNLKDDIQSSSPRMPELRKYISELLIGMNLDDIEEINLIIKENNNLTEKFGVKIFNFDGRVDNNKFWHQARGIFLKLSAFDAIIGEATELKEEEYTAGKRSFYIVVLTNGRYPCNELDEWIPADRTELSFNAPSTAVPLRTVENGEFKLETFAIIPDDIVPDSQE